MTRQISWAIPIIVLAFSGAAAGAECSATQVMPHPAIATEVDAIVDEALAAGFAGGVAISKDGTLIYRRAAGPADLAGHVAVGPETLFHVASMTKYFTAILVLEAAEEGALELDAPIAPYVAGTRLADRDYTFADLLAHRSGLGSSYAAEGTDDPRQALLAIDATDVDESLAGSFRYSNDGYDLLGIILERIYERPYEDLVRDKLMAPACVERVGFWGTTDIGDPRQVSQPLRELPEALLSRNYGMLASAGLLVTAEELVRFQDALRGGKLLDPASLAELTAPRGETSIGAATYGAFLVERPGLGRALSVRGYEDWGDNGYLNDYLDCGVTLAVLTSRGPAEDSGRPAFRVSISESIEQRVLPALCRESGQ